MRSVIELVAGFRLFKHGFLTLSRKHRAAAAAGREVRLRNLLRSSRAHEFVAKSSNGDNQFRVPRIVLEFVAQAGNMHIDGAGERAGIISPDRA